MSDNNYDAENDAPQLQGFKGHPTVVLRPNSRWPFSIGLAKAKLILANIEVIRRFAESEGKSID